MLKSILLTGIAVLAASTILGPAKAQSSTPAFCDSYTYGLQDPSPYPDWVSLCRALNYDLGEPKIVVTQVQLQTTENGRCTTTSTVLGGDVDDPWNHDPKVPLIIERSIPGVDRGFSKPCSNNKDVMQRENGPVTKIGLPSGHVTEIIRNLINGGSGNSQYNSILIGAEYYEDGSSLIPRPMIIAASKTVGCDDALGDCKWKLNYYDYLCGVPPYGGDPLPSCPKIVIFNANPNGWDRYYIHGAPATPSPNPPPLQGASRLITVTFGFDIGIGGPQETSWKRYCSSAIVQSAKKHFADDHGKHICHCFNITNGQCP